jgi:hypothetical protein
MRAKVGCWRIYASCDDDGHLNLYLLNDEDDHIIEIESGQGDGIEEQLALRFTTRGTETKYLESIDNVKEERCN